jgi:hypothetical protein
MENQIDGESLLRAITKASEGQFAIEANSAGVKKMLDLAPEGLIDRSVIRLKRIVTQTPYWRTIIISSISLIREINLVLQWAATVKDDLLDPESSDLYLMLAVNDPVCALETCINIEAGEQFCRKYVLRPRETLDAFIERTFLGSISGVTGDGDISDPLLAALAATGQDYAWFTPAIQQQWHAALTSGKTSAELIELLFIPEKTENADS